MPDEKMNHADGARTTHSEATTAGRSLRKIFRQDDFLRKIMNQPARVSLLMNDARMRIYVHLFRNPGDHMRSIARSAGLNLNSVNLHLSRLESADYIESINMHGKKVYWPGGMVESGDMEMILTIRHDWSIKMLKIMYLEGKPMKQADIVGKMKDSQQIVDVRLRKMASAGLVDKTGKGRSTRYAVQGDLPVKYRMYLALSKETAKSTLSVLRKDGLMPSDARVNGTRLTVNLHPPGSTRRIHLECNPLAPMKNVFSGNKG